MVAVVTSKGAGIENSSASVLGSKGQLLGSSSLGRGGENVYVNAATGNLVLTAVDEMLVGCGPDAVVSRAYNSLGAWDGDNDDYWRAGVYRRVTGLSGTYGNAGTTVKRTDWDGSEAVYTWNADYYSVGVGAYVSTDGGGAYDTLTRTGSTWTWTDGDSQITESFDDATSGRITARTDTDGNSVTYTYTGSLITRVTTSGNSGLEYTDLVYTGTQLGSLVTYSTLPTAQITRTYYEYDGSDRLVTVKVNMAPADNSNTTGTNYVTTYTYDGFSQRVASIAQSDGTLLTITYDGSNRVSTIVQTVATGTTRTTSFAYDTANLTRITDNANQATLVYHDNGNLTKVVTPPVGADNQPLVQEFSYEADGDVVSVRLGPGNSIAYTDSSTGYDPHGNRQLERDGAGNTIKRHFGSKNELLTETHYLGPDPDGAGSSAATTPVVTRYVYDAENHLRYRVTPEGRVTEYRYDSFGQRISEIDYAGSVYSGTALTDSNAAGLLDTWVSGTASRAAAQRTDTWYDFRGNIARTASYATLNAYGEGSQGPAAIVGAMGTSVVQQPDGLYRATKTAGSANAFNADAHSTAAATGDFVLQLRPGGTAGTVAGVSTAPAASAANSGFAYGILFHTDGKAYRNGTDGSTLLGTYIPGDSYWIARVGSTVSYHKGSSLAAAIAAGALGTATGATGTYYVDSSIYASGQFVDIGFTPQPIVSGGNTSVVEQLDGLTRVTRTSGGNAWNADARGSVAATGDFALRVRPAQANKYIAAGVSTAPAADTGLTLNYGFYLWSNGTLGYTEAGGAVSLTTTYSAGDNLWLVRVGTTLGYYRGATLEAAMAAGALRTVTGVSSTLYFDSSFYDLSGAIDVAFTPGSLSSPEVSRTDYVYDPSGRLLFRAIAGQGVESFVYDGMGRITSSKDFNGATTSIAFGDTSGPTTTVTLANGLVQTSTYNRAGELVSYTESGTDVVTATTSYGYDNLGRLRFVSAPKSATETILYTSYYFYDAVGRKIADIDADGSVTEYRYDANNYLTSTTAYANKLTSTQLNSLVSGGAPTSVTFASIRPTADANNDRWDFNVYDRAQRLVQTIDGTGSTTIFAYDGASQLVSTTKRANLVSSAALTTLKAQAVAPNLWANPDNAALWVQGGAAYASAGTLSGFPAFTVSTVTTGVAQGLGMSGTVSVSAGDTIRQSYWLKADTVGSAWLHIWSTVSAYGSNADVTATVASGPGSIETYGSAVRVTGLSSSVATLVTVTRTFRQTEAASMAFYPGAETAGPTAGESVVVARPVVTLQAGQPVNLPTADPNNDRVSRAFYDNDGRLIGALDAEGCLTQTIYDAAGRKIRTVAYANASPSAVPAADHSATFTGVTTSSTDDISNYWLYDARGLLRAAIDGEGTVTRFDYTPAGYLSQQVSGQKVTPGTAYTLATLPAPGGSEILETTAWTRNLYGQALTETRTLTGSTTTTTTYSYDNMRRLVSTVTQAGGTDPRTYSQRYDKQGRLKSELSGAGNAWLAANPTQIEAAYTNYGWTYVYDPAGRLVSKTGPKGAASAGPKTLYYYNADGALIYEVGATGEVAEYRYNAFGERTDVIVYANRISDLSGMAGGLDASLVVSRLTLSSTTDSVVHTDFNVDGTVKQVDDPLGNRTTYTYNAFGELGSTTAPLDDDGGSPRSIVTNRTYDRRGLLKTETVDTAIVNGVAGKNIQTSYGYDAFGRAITLTNALSKVTTSTYDRKGRLKTTSVSPASGTTYTTTYTYDARDNLVAVKDALNKITLYVYDKANRRIATIDALGGVTTTSYDADGRVIATRAYANRVGSTPLATLQTALEVSETTFATTLSGLTLDPAADHVTRYAYEKDGQLRFTVDGLRHVVEHGYDAQGNEVRTTAYDGAIGADGTGAYSTSYIADQISTLGLASAGGTRVVRAVYDAVNRLTYSIDAIGQVTWTVYDTKGQLIRQVEYAVAYTGTGDPTKVDMESWSATSPVAAQAGNDRTTRAYYDRKGQLAYSVDALGYVTQIEYDKRGNVKTQTCFANPTTLTLSDTTALTALASDLGTPSSRRITTFAYDSAGRLEKTTDPEGFVTRLALDAMGRITTSTAADGSTDASGASVTAYDYDDLGRVVKETRGSGASEASSTWFFYDPLGQNIATVDGDNYLSVRTFDALGQVTAETRYATRINPTSYAVATGTAVSTLLGWVGTNAADIATAAGYDAFGRVTSTTDGRGSVTANTYDLIDQLLTQTEQMEGGGTERVTSYVYDSFGNAVKVTDPRGNDSYAIFDKLGRVTRQVDAERFVTDTSYTRGGQVASVKRWQVGPNLWQTPGDGALWSGSGATRTANGTIDGANAYTLAVSASGTPGYTTQTTGTAVVAGNKVTFSFWVKKGSVDFASFGLSGSGGWGSNGDSVAAILTGPGTLTQTGGGLWSVSGLDTSQATLIAITRTYQTTETATARVYAGSSTSSAVSGNSVVIARPVMINSDATTTFAYNKRDELTSVTDAESGVESYALNAFGERTAVTNKLGGITAYEYDKRGLVTKETLPTSITTIKAGDSSTISVVNKFTYDGRGNRLTTTEAFEAVEARGTTYAYDKLDRLVTTTGDAVTVVKDDLTSAVLTPVETRSYDRRGNLVETIVELGTTDARTLAWYDGFGRKIAEADPMGSLTRWVYDKAGNVTSMKRYGTLETMGSLTSASAVPTGSGTCRETVYAYDRSNRLTTTTVAGVTTGEYASGSFSTATSDIVTTLEYDKSGNVVRQEDGRLNDIWSWYDKLGRKTAQVDAENYLTVWTRDAEGNALSETRYATQITGSYTTASTVAALQALAGTNANDRTTTFTYDRNGRRLTEARTGVASVAIDGTTGAATTGATTATITYTYNGLGQVLSKTEANGDATNYAYDAIGRLTLETGQSFKSNAWVSGGDDVAPRTAYAYDGLNNLKSTRVQAAATANDTNDRITTYTYGAGGRLATMTDAAGFTHTYGYDLAGHTVRDSYRRYKSDGTYVDEAQVTRYDLAGRAITQTNARYTGSAWVFTSELTGNPAYDAVRIQYNAFGEVTGKGITAGPAATAAYQEAFEYDSAGRLWNSTQGDGVKRYYLYDKAGNRTLEIAPSGGTTALAFAAASNLAAALTTAGGTTTSNAVTTLTVYDKRSQAIATREPDRQLTASGTSTITHAKTYNAFGEVASETDGRGYTTSFTYNTMGRLTQKVSPQVSVTAENGAQSNVNPTENYAYDISGRLSKVTDANGNVTTRALLAGTGHDDSEALVSKEFHPDGGVFETRYDVFGDVRSLINEIGNTEARDYDKLGQLITQTHPLRTGGVQLVDHYVYDILGQRTRHWNSQFGSSAVELTNYDAKGRVVSEADYMGTGFTYTYAWTASLVTTGLGTFGGWAKTIVNKAGLTATETSDYFGRTIDNVDYGSHDYAYTFDKAGRLTAQTHSGGESISNSWYNSGRLYQTTVNGTTSSYAYDADGRVTAETVGSIRAATMAYDALGRRTSFYDGGPSGGLPVTVTWAYDAVGNIRVTQANYRPIGSGSNASTASWYKYDSMNRYTLAKGTLSGGAIVRGSAGVELLWNTAGQRKAQTGKWFNYTEDGYLLSAYDVEASTLPTSQPTGIGQLADSYSRDALGRVTVSGTAHVVSNFYTYNMRGDVLSEISGYAPWYETRTYFTYATGGGRVVGTEVANYGYNPYYQGMVQNGTTVYTTTSYNWWDSAQQNVVGYAGSVTSTFSYSASGHVASVYVADGSPHTITYATDANGQILTRTDGSLTDVYYGIAGFNVGSVTSLLGGSADFDQGYQPLTQETGRTTSYAVQSGDTLRTIAEKTWGDASLWYKIAEANGLSGEEPLAAGRSLLIPGDVRRAHYNDGTFEPYDPNKAQGYTGPEFALNPPQSPFANQKGCGIIGQILMIAVAVAITIAIRVPVAKFFTGLLAHSMGAATAGVVGGIVGGAATGAIASTGSQLFGLAAGIQDKFSFKGVAMSAIAGGVGAGVGASGAFGAVKSGFVQGALQAAAGNAITQGIQMAVGLQNKFDFAGLAVAGVVGGIGAWGERHLPGHAEFKGGSWTDATALNEHLSSAASAIAGAAARSVLTGTSFGDNILAVLPDVIGSTVGRMVGSSIENRFNDPRGDAQRASQDGSRRRGDSSDKHGAQDDTSKIPSPTESVVEAVPVEQSPLAEFAKNPRSEQSGLKYVRNDYETATAGWIFIRTSPDSIQAQYPERFPNDGYGFNTYFDNAKPGGTLSIITVENINNGNNLKYALIGSNTYAIPAGSAAIHLGHDGVTLRYGPMSPPHYVNAAPTKTSADAPVDNSIGTLAGEAWAGIKEGFSGLWSFASNGWNSTVGRAYLPQETVRQSDATWGRTWQNLTLMNVIEPFARATEGLLLHDDLRPSVRLAGNLAAGGGAGKVLGVAGSLGLKTVGRAARAFGKGEVPEPVGPRKPTDGGGCFVAGTPVHTREGIRPIEDIRIGDWVLSQPELTGARAERRVIETFVYEDKAVFAVTVVDQFGRTDIILTTSVHPFWVKGVGWTGMEYLSLDDVLELQDGSEARILSIEDTGELDRVYNFTVDSFHTYYVGELGVWVHNVGECPDAVEKPVNGNSKASKKPQHGYEIYEAESGDVVKTGVSGEKLNVNGTSPRANRQVNKFSSDDVQYKARIKVKNVETRTEILDWEEMNTNKLHQEGHSLSKQKRPKPDS